MLRIKQIGTICFAISILISAPLFATDIPSSASTANCKYSPLQVYSGTSNLEANWSPNVIQITWYNGDDQYASNSCTYGGNLTMPSNIPTREGYTFRGWRARQSGGGQQSQQCSFSNLNITTNGSSYGALATVWSGSDYIVSGSNASDYNLTQPDTWGVTFTNGKVTGISYCGETNDGKSYGQTGNPGSGAEYGIHCWCKATGYTLNGGNLCQVSSPWVYNGEAQDLYSSSPIEEWDDEMNDWVYVYPVERSASDECRESCLGWCANSVMNDSSFRAAMGLTQ